MKINTLWYSEQQNRIGYDLNDKPIFVLTPNGWKQYTEWSHKNKPTGLWGDYRLVHISNGKVIMKCLNGPINVFNEPKTVDYIVGRIYGLSCNANSWRVRKKNKKRLKHFLDSNK